MYLNRSIPLLFATPSAASSRTAIISTLLILLLAVTIYLVSELWASTPYFMYMTVLIGCHGYVCLTTTGGNLLYIFRYFLVWILIFGTAYVWFMYPGEVFVAPFGLNFQSNENTKILVLAGMISLCGSLMGWHIALIRSRNSSDSLFYIKNQHRQALRRTGLFVASLFVLLYVWKAGGLIGGGRVYGDGKAGFTLQFGVFNLFHFTGIALILLGSIGKSRIRTRYIFISILTLMPGMLAGSRADFLPQAFILFLLVFNSSVQKIIVTRSYFQGFKYFLTLLVIFFVAYLVATYIAIARSGIDPVIAFDIMLTNENGWLINSIYGHRMLYFETGNMMLGGLYSAIVQVKEGYTGLLYGQSYFNYLLISPPAFLGLPRPLGLEWFTEINGITMTQGGIFEVAEAYWNFGLIGCFFVSFFLSYAFAWLLNRGLKRSNYFYLTWYIVYGLHGFRAIWYQNFGYFRLMTVMLVIYILCTLFFRWFLVSRSVAKS